MLFSVLAFVGAIAFPARADVADDLEAALNGLRGDEFTGTIPVSVLGVNVTIDVLGFAFCTPPDPTAPPATTPTPPLNLYGCQNGVVVTAQPAGSDTLAVSVTADELFVDLHTTRDRTVLCGELPGGTRAADGYLLTSATATVSIRTELLEGCTVYRLVPGSLDLQLGTLDLESDDSCATLVSALVGLLEPMFDTQLTAQFESMLDAALRQRNHDVCGEVADRTGTWGSLKAEFGRE